MNKTVQKGFSSVILLVIIVIVLAGIGGYYILKKPANMAVSPTPTPKTTNKACTEEGKICPDGSIVSRVGPNCEFAPCPSANQIIYTNNQYGFDLSLPQSWKGYSVTSGLIPDGSSGGGFGWEVILRHPKWTKANPREDIPIQVFTIDQWKKWEADNFESYPTAAPMGPTERGRNSKYVFATAPRYNYDFLTGYEEVEEIIKALKAF